MAEANNVANISLGLGAVSLLGHACCCIPFVSAIMSMLIPMCAVGAIVTGVMGRNAAAELDGEGMMQANIGLGMGLVVILMDVGIFAATFLGFFSLAILDSM